MGAGNTQGVQTNADKVLEILHERDLSGDQAAQRICDALGVDPEGQFSPSQ